MLTDAVVCLPGAALSRRDRAPGTSKHSGHLLQAAAVYHAPAMTPAADGSSASHTYG